MTDEGSRPTPTEQSAAPESVAGLVDAGAAGIEDAPKSSGGLGGILGAILKGLEPARRATRRRRRTRTTRSTRSTGGWFRRVTRRRSISGTAGPLLGLRYHDA